MRTLVLLAAVSACSHPLVPAGSQLPSVSPAQASAAAPASAASPAVASAAAPPGEAGFEFKVRADFFDGLRGDTAALDRAIQVCEEMLATHPDHPEAMVWHGAGMIGRSSLAFRGGDRATGMALYTKGLAEMDRAVELAPNNVGVRIPRGAVVLTTASFVPEPEKSRLLQRGVGDYEVALAAQAPRFKSLTLHAREQLLYGLTDGYAGLGNAAKAQVYYQRMLSDAAGSPLIPRARARAVGEVVAGQTPCEQCHGR